MNINKDNYQAFILDYYEGNLSDEQAAILMSFLEKHREFKEDFSEFEIINLQEDNIVLNDKGLLKKPEPEFSLPVTAENFELFCIAETEGLLTPEEVEELNLFVSQSPNYERTRKVYSLAFIEPDKTVVFKGKEDLIKEPVFSVSNKPTFKRPQISLTRKLWYNISAAAVVLFLAGLFFMNDLFVDSGVQYADTATKDSESAADTTRELVGPAIATPLFADSPPADLLKPEKKPVKVVESNQKDTQEVIEIQPLKASMLAALSPGKLQPMDEIQDVSIQQQTQSYTPLIQAIYESPYGEETPTLPQLALTEFQKRAGIDVAPERFSVWDLAGSGLAAISQIRGNPLTVQKERNQQGKVTYLAIGNSFEISRSKRGN